LVKIFSYWEKRIADPILFPRIYRTVSKAKPFIKFDRDKMKHILLDTFSQS
jgi:hypothetical protein